MLEKRSKCFSHCIRVFRGNSPGVEDLVIAPPSSSAQAVVNESDTRMRRVRFVTGQQPIAATHVEMLTTNVPLSTQRIRPLQRCNLQDNPGFKLLMKLGYKGGGLGKDGAGIAKPIAPEIKQGRAG